MQVVVAQHDSGDDVAENLGRAVATIESRPEADLIAFPELYLNGYVPESVAETAIEPDGEEMRTLAEACRANSTAVVIGFAERRDGEVANSLGAIDHTGKLVAVYRKTHLFDKYESGAFRRGDDLVIAELGGVKCGLLICFDIEFPEPARALALAGAEMLVSASANMQPYATDHEVASRARALDNRLPHVYANRAGTEGEIEFVGESRLIASDGKVIAELGYEPSELAGAVAAGTKPPDEVDYLEQARDDLKVNGGNRVRRRTG